MEWMVKDGIANKMRRKFSNETMRKIKEYIDTNKLKKATEGYNDVLKKIDDPIITLNLREPDEIIKDQESLAATPWAQ
jgi:hypothetical protein